MYPINSAIPTIYQMLGGSLWGLRAAARIAFHLNVGTGEVPAELSQLTQLEELCLEMNQLSGGSSVSLCL